MAAACEGERTTPDDVESPVTYDFAALCQNLPHLHAWDIWDTEGAIVIEALTGIKEAAHAEYESRGGDGSGQGSACFVCN